MTNITRRTLISCLILLILLAACVSPAQRGTAPVPTDSATPPPAPSASPEPS